MNEVLKPCPECKSNDVYLSQYTNHDGSLFEKQMVCCGNCGCKSPHIKTNEAIEAWNKRHE